MARKKLVRFGFDEAHRVLKHPIDEVRAWAKKAMHELVAGELKWRVGTLGSVWVDKELAGRMTRVALRPCNEGTNPFVITMNGAEFDEEW